MPNTYSPPPLSSMALRLLLSEVPEPASEPTSKQPTQPSEQEHQPHTPATPVNIPRKPRSSTTYDLTPTSLTYISTLPYTSDPTTVCSDFETHSDLDLHHHYSDDETSSQSDLEDDPDQEEEQEDLDIATKFYKLPSPVVSHPRSAPIDIPIRSKRPATSDLYQASKSYRGSQSMFASDPCGNVRGRDGVWYAPDGGVVPGKPEEWNRRREREMLMRTVVW